jgi:hypothetical protein
VKRSIVPLHRLIRGEQAGIDETPERVKVARVTPPPAKAN